MGLKKALLETKPLAGAEKAAHDALKSGTAAAVERLKVTKTVDTTKGYKPRDFNAEARGKTRCVQFEAALQSPAIAGMRFETMEEYLKLVKEAADAGTAYTFGDK